MVLAIKADQLAGINTAAELQDFLHLPDSVERVIRRVSRERTLVLLVDQIDALSLSLAHDQKTLNGVLDIVARARLSPNVRVIISCRVFDLHNDPRLGRINVSKQFHIQELSDNEIQSVLAEVGAEFAALAPATQKLLGTPLHLDLFARALTAQPADERREDVGHGISSLQELYALLWRYVICDPDPQAPPIIEREQVLRLLTDFMDKEQRTSAPQSLITIYAEQNLVPAANWLASQGILLPNGNEWNLIHQTFFDYCYAKNFIEKGGVLSKLIIESRKNQGLFARPKVVQVLTYLRGTNPPAYLRELSILLNDSTVRYHLQDHIRGWFGGRTDPSDREWLIARRILADPNRRRQLLMTMGGNRGWFSRLKDELTSNLASQSGDTLERETIPMLSSMMEVSQAEIVEIVSPFLGRDEDWNRRVQWILGSVRNWHTVEAAELFERALRFVPVSELKNMYMLDDVAKAHPRVGCRMIRSVFDRFLEDYLANRRADAQPFRPSISSALEVFNGSTVVESLKAITEAELKCFLDEMLPWIESVLNTTEEPTVNKLSYVSDPLSYGWYDGGFVVQHQLTEATIDALARVAQSSCPEFKQAVARLASLQYETPQRLLAHAYRKVAALYPDDALQFLLTDQRRFNLGDHEQYDTRQLIKALLPFVSNEQCALLEEAVCSYTNIHKYYGIAGLGWRGLDQLYLLQCFPLNRLTARGSELLRQLERKFPGVQASGNPSSIRSGSVGSPISIDAVSKMSDGAWLKAMSKYKNGVEHSHPFKGGASQLGGNLAQAIKNDPQRFFELAMRVPLDIDESYRNAFINGFADSAAPADNLYQVVRRFASVAERDNKRTIAWVLLKRTSEGLPDDLTKLLESYVRAPANEDETWYLREENHDSRRGRNGLNDGAYSSYLNSVRGSAFHTLMRAFDHEGGEKRANHKWEMIEFAAAGDSVALHAGVIEELCYLLSSDRERAVVLYEKLVNDCPGLLRSHFAQEFLLYGSYKHFARMKPFILMLMYDEYEEAQQRGAEIACLVFLSYRSSTSGEERAERQSLAAMTQAGTVTWRRGAARIYSNNINSDAEAECAEGLLYLLNDSDKEVRNHNSRTFYALKDDHVFSLRKFIESYAASASLHESAYKFSDYMWEHGVLDPEWALSIIETVLKNDSGSEPMLRVTRSEKFIRLVLRIYTDPSVDDVLRERAMDTFDKLIEKFGGNVQTVLHEWDRN